MPRYTDTELKQIKTTISLLALAQQQGHKAIKQGKDYALSCPFHSGDDTPSLIISPTSNLFHCFGCDAAGSVIDWVMRVQGVSFRNAVEVLRNGSLIDTGSVGMKHQPKNTLASLVADADASIRLTEVIDYYHDTLKQSPDVLAYLKKRGLDNVELIDTFKLGYANRTLGYRLPDRQHKAGREMRTQLQSIGIFRSSGHEHFSGSLVVPIINDDGVVTEVYGRKILGERLRKGTAQHLYLPGAHQGIWNRYALAAFEEIILCEALIDAMTFWVHGFRNVTSSYGTGGFTDEHLAAFKSCGIRRVLIAYDRDDAGNRAADKLTAVLIDAGIDVFRVLLPKNMDVNEYALSVTPATKSLGVALRQSQWLGNGNAPVITSVMGVVDSSDADFSLAANTTISTTATEQVIAEPSSPMPAVIEGVSADVHDHEVHITLDSRHYRIRGLAKNMSYEQLKVNVLVSCNDTVYVDSFDLYQSRPRLSFIKQASVELGCRDDVIKSDLGKLLLKLEQLQDEQIKGALEPSDTKPELSKADKIVAMTLLQDSNLLQRVVSDLTLSGIVGEDSNKLVGYLACVSRLLDKPLAIIIQSSSAAGKSSLMDAILTLVPEEERVQYSAMTGQSLFYMGETNLKHKILAIAEEAGAEQASYALKLLQSEGELTIASTGKDDSSGNLVTKEYRVEGPVMLFLTTTAIDIDEELMNRCLVLTVNESREQTQAIHVLQRQQQTLQGLLHTEDRKAVIQLHRNAQRLLRPLLVANPFAEQLTFIDDKTRTRRDHMKYLTLIRSIALLHQYQRPIKTVVHQGQNLEYIEVIARDIEQANVLAHDILGRSLDELPPQTRTLLKLIYQFISQCCEQQSIKQSDYRFTRKEVREFTSWGNTQLKLHLSRLEDMEYLLAHRGGRGQSFVYELVYSGEGESGDSFLSGLIAVDQLGYDEKKSGVETKLSGASRPQVAPKSGGGRVVKSALKSSDSKALSDKVPNNANNAVFREDLTSHHNHTTSQQMAAG